jgi:hypothetical protein
MVNPEPPQAPNTTRDPVTDPVCASVAVALIVEFEAVCAVPNGLVVSALASAIDPPISLPDEGATDAVS